MLQSSSLTMKHAKILLLVLLYCLLLQVILLVVARPDIYDTAFRLVVTVAAIPLLALRSRLAWRASPRLFLILLVIYSALHFFYQIGPYFAGPRSGGDSAMFEQILWNFTHTGEFGSTLGGQYIAMTAPEPVSHFAGHNSPILFLAAIPYAILPSPITLMALQTIATAITGWFAYLYLRTVTASDNILTVFVPFTLLLHGAMFLMPQFYEMAFAPPLLMWSALAFKLDKRWQFVVALILLALVKETLFPVIIAWAVVAWITRRSWFYILTPIAVALASAIFSFGIIGPAFSNGRPNYWTDRFLPVILALRFDYPGIGRYWFEMLMQWGGLNFLSPLGLLALPDMLMNSMLSAGSDQSLGIAIRFQLAAVIGLYVGTVEALVWLARRWEQPVSTDHPSLRPAFLNRMAGWSSTRLQQFKRAIGRTLSGSELQSALWVLVLTLTVGSAFIQFWSIQNAAEALMQRHWQSDMACMSQVPAEEPVVCDFKICGYFAQRSQVWAYRYVTDAEGIWTRARWGVFLNQYLPDLDAYGWELVCDGGTISVYSK
jgi:hypothetical protein